MLHTFTVEVVPDIESWKSELLSSSTGKGGVVKQLEPIRFVPRDADSVRVGFLQLLMIMCILKCFEAKTIDQIYILESKY